MYDVLYLVLVLLVVAAVLYLSFRFSKFLSKQGGRIGGSSQNMRVLDRLVIGADRFLMIVELQEKYYLVSSSPQAVEILKELEGFTLPEEPEGGTKNFGESFKTVLQDYVQKRKK